MYRPKIIRVWGKADSFEIEFTHMGGTRWEASVPPDTNDGQYAVEIWAMNEFKETAHWTGELYMCNGVCCVKFHRQPYRIWISKNDFIFDFMKSNSDMIIGKKNFIFSFRKSSTDLIIEKGCCCA